MQRRWLIHRTNPEYIHYLSKSASVSPSFAQILIRRGIKTAMDAQEFLHPGTECLSDPFDFPDMQAALERIKAARVRNERVLIHGDYDADGLTATAILVSSLEKLSLDVHYSIPNRMLHGYGFNMPAVDAARKLGAGLVITVDCGITSFEAVEASRKNGIDVIITDHHEPLRHAGSLRPDGKARGEFLVPDAVAVVNPKLQNHSPRISNLSGAGIAFKIAQGIAGDDDLPFSSDDAFSMIDLAALGTIADVVPMIGENRFLVKEGVKKINTAPRPGIQSLRDISGLQRRELKSGLLSFTLVPRINAAGRIADARDVIRLLLSNKTEEASKLSFWLDGLNAERQRIEGEIYQEALTQISETGTDTAIVLAKEKWHNGVLGIVASRIAEEFYRPAFIFSVEDEIAKGSARSIPPFDICHGLAACSTQLLSFGGHRQAAGITLKAKDIPAFGRQMRDIIRDSLTPEDLIPSLEIDSVISLPEINHRLLREFGMLEPLGYGNPEPLMGSKGLDVLYPRIVGNNHLKMKLRQNSCSIDTIGFNLGASFEALTDSATIDAVFTPAVNEWKGGRTLQLVLKAFRTSEYEK